MVSEGGGFCSLLLHCDKCGKEKNIGFDELEENHLGRDYKKQVEHFAGTCDCGGKFRFSGKPRCPKCHSLKYKELTAISFYD